MNKGSNLTGMPHLQMQLANLTPSYEPVAPLLPEPATPELARRITLVLDLDETLVHSSFTPFADADFVLPLQMGTDTHMVFVRKRPRVDAFLAAVSRWYEVIVFTASLALYANPVVDELDNGRTVHGRLYREHCVLVGSHFVKDLARLGRPLSRVLILDNSPLCYVLQPENAVPISGFVDDPNDRELDKTLAFLEAARHLDDVRHRGGSLSSLPQVARPAEEDASAPAGAAAAAGAAGAVNAPLGNGTLPLDAAAPAAAACAAAKAAGSMQVDSPRIGSDALAAAAAAAHRSGGYPGDAEAMDTSPDGVAAAAAALTKEGGGAGSTVVESPAFASGGGAGGCGAPVAAAAAHATASASSPGGAPPPSPAVSPVATPAAGPPPPTGPMHVASTTRPP